MSVSTVPDQRVRGARTEIAAAVFSAVAVLVAVWWWVAPEAYPMREPEPMSLVSGPWTGTDSVLMIGLGVLGLVTAVAMRRAAGSRWLHRSLVGVAALQIGVYVGIVADVKVLILLGYLLALFGPATLLAVLAVGAWRYPPARYVLAAVVAVAAVVGVSTGMARISTVLSVARGIAGIDPDTGFGILVVGAGFAAGCVWIATLVRYVRRTTGRCVSCGRAGVAAVGEPVRWGTWVTVAAALCPLPYALIRITWLTPWPVGFDHAELVANPELRLFGVSLGLAAIGGSVLTLGLIRPWGEVFPRWIPVLRSRPVPVRLPAAIGLLVGAAVTVAGRSLVQLVFADPADEWGMLLVFPFPVWGPLLIAASIAYYLRRRGRCAVCGAR